MKKTIITLLLTCLMLTGVAANTSAILPGYENSKSQYKIADYTLEFLHADGRGGGRYVPGF
jgi:hypothetical protein